MRLFLDTSALAKRYVAEPGSERLDELLHSVDSLGLSVMVLPELVSTLRRLVREGQIAEADYAELKRKILADLDDAELCDLSPRVLQQAIGCLERNALRALDAIHIGSALTYRPDLFVSADRRQLDAARSEGLAVEALGL